MDPIKKHLFGLFACLFVVMFGFGITLPVLPFYIERLALEAGASLPGGVLFIWQINAPYLISGAVLIALSLVIAWKVMDKQRKTRVL